MVCYKCGKDNGNQLGLCEQCKSSSSEGRTAESRTFTENNEPSTAASDESDFKQHCSIDSIRNQVQHGPQKLRNTMLGLLGCCVICLSLGFAAVQVFFDERPAAVEIENIVKKAIVKSNRCQSIKAHFEYFSISEIGTMVPSVSGFPIRSNFSLVCPTSLGTTRYHGDASRVIEFVRRDMLNEWETFTPQYSIP